MAVDSVHLADLLLSVIGDQLSNQQSRLPHEVSRVFRAEQLRLATGFDDSAPKTSEDISLSDIVDDDEEPTLYSVPLEDAHAEPWAPRTPANDSIFPPSVSTEDEEPTHIGSMFDAPSASDTSDEPHELGREATDPERTVTPVVVADRGVLSGGYPPKIAMYLAALLVSIAFGVFLALCS